MYTGHESKYMLNSTMVPLKRSTVEKVVNRQVLNITLISAAESIIGVYSCNGCTGCVTEVFTIN